MPRIRSSRVACFGCLLGAAVMIAGVVQGEADHLWVARFSAQRPHVLPPDWERLSLPNVPRQTHYGLAHVNDRVALKAEADSSASAVMNRMDVDPRAFPYLEWSWNITRAVPSARWQDKARDDFAARLFVAFDSPGGPSLFARLFMKKASDVWPGRTLNYVWASDVEVGQMARSPHTDLVAMIVAESGDARTRTWVRERRNVFDDFTAAFHETPPKIIGIALMTDTDDTGSRLVAYYGDIRFTRAGRDGGLAETSSYGDCPSTSRRRHAAPHTASTSTGIP